jgi:hypothetical protein
MENPATWTTVERTIHDAQNTHRALMAEHPDLCAVSEVSKIAEALRAAGLLREDVQITSDS